MSSAEQCLTSNVAKSQRAQVTTRQQQAFEFILANQVKAGPTLRELADHLGVSGNAAQRHVEALRKASMVAENAGNGIVALDPGERILTQQATSQGFAPINPKQTKFPVRKLLLKPSGKL